jgi:hypothetical protein
MRHPVCNGPPVMAQLIAAADMTVGLRIGDRAEGTENSNGAN